MASSIRVLCVDDEPDLADLVATYLMGHADDIDAIFATSGTEALQVIAAEDIDCIICDYRMPEMDGLELLEEVRDDYPTLPFILFTGRGSEDVASQAVRAGVSDYIPKDTGTKQYELLCNRVRNLVERARAQRTTRELFNAANDAILVHDFESGVIIDVNEAATTLWGVNREELIGRLPGDFTAGEDASNGDAWLGIETDEDGTLDWECIRPDDSTFWAEIRMKAAHIDGEDRLLTLARDVTRRKRREERLGSLLQSASQLVGARDFDTIGDVVATTMTDTLGFDGAGVVIDTGEADDLHVAGTSGTIALNGGSDEMYDQARRLLGQRSHISDGGTTIKAPQPEAVGDQMYWPIGDRAVLIAQTEESDRGGFTTDLVNLLLAISTTAVIRTFQDHQLERQHEELESLNRINELIRDINQTLVKVSTRDEIESLVCQQLATAAPIVCAWIGEHDLRTDELRVRMAIGRGADEVESDLIRTGTDSDDALGRRLTETIERREVVSITELSGDTIGADRAARSEELGYQSMTFIPITYQNALYDVLAVYAHESHPFGDEQRQVLRELGETIGYALHTAERSRALLSDTTVELEYEIRDTDALLTGLSASLNAEVELERIFFRSDDSARMFVRIDDAPLDDIEAYLRLQHGPDVEVREIMTSDLGIVVEIIVDELPLMKHLAEDMASIRSAIATDGIGRLVVEIPKGASVRTLTENLSLVYDDVSLLARRQRDRDSSPFGDSSGAQDLGLTDRQHEVLLTAYHAGFFSWPRESTGEEIAELLDISQPTYHEHLRTGERKVLEILFEEQRSIYT